MFSAREAVRRDALHEYRDEITAKRRRYADMYAAEGGWHRRLRKRRSSAIARLELTDEQRGLLASWRFYTVPGDDTPRPVEDDPTSEEREPDLRRFEREGDPPLWASSARRSLCPART